MFTDRRLEKTNSKGLSYQLISMNAHVFSVNVSSLSNVTVTDEEPGPVWPVEAGAEIVQVTLASVIILVSLLALVTASLVTRRRGQRRSARQSALAAAIIGSGENRAVSREIEDSLAQQRDTLDSAVLSSFVGDLPALPSRLTLSPLENDSSLRYKIRKIFKKDF